MKRFALAVIGALAIASFGASSVAHADENITIKAKNFEFTPKVVTLKAGVPAHLTFVATQGVHGMTAPEIGLTQTVTVTNKPTTVTVTPAKVGTFPAHCALVCGPGHGGMVMTFKVVK